MIGEIVLILLIDTQETLHSLEVGQEDGRMKEILDMGGEIFLI